ncbi:MAG: serine hydrolase [Roseitalea sp.]|jgi:CubicO group peptidase (beta-lactamase class C family)|nr:serine hydrolase [Roseitalea sp.]MBO6723685.1 serine hydrolase [Roseitalea sp.]MBO6744025.1 serine hydrolase [Roseitalea sp.]
MRILKTLGLLLVVLLVAGLGYLFVAPPDLIRVGANYAAKIVCSNVFLAGRDAQEVLAIDVQAPGHPLLTLMRVDVDEDAGTVRTGLFGLIGGGLAVHRPGQGCSSVPEGGVDRLVDRPAPTRAALATGSTWPAGGRVELPVNEALDAVLNDPALTGPGMRAVVVVKDGAIVGERYAHGFAPETPLLGWSVSKTVTGALIGRAIREGRLDLDQTASLEGWDGDGRADITARHMMGMAPDLVWNEGYGSVSDVTRMLYLETDMAGFVAGQPRDDDSPEGVGDVFEYSSGTTVLLSRIWQDAFDDPAEAAVWPYAALFDPLGMASAVMEMDASGTFVGSSYIYATARDWARFGQFMLQRGVWNGRSLLPVGFVDWMVTPHPASDGVYGNGQVWLRAANAWMEGDNPDLPDDGFYMNGHDGQSVSVIPSEDLVVVRLGLTPTDRRYKVAHLIEAVIEVLDAR